VPGRGTAAIIEKNRAPFLERNDSLSSSTLCSPTLPVRWRYPASRHGIEAWWRNTFVYQGMSGKSNALSRIDPPESGFSTCNPPALRLGWHELPPASLMALSAIDRPRPRPSGLAVGEHRPARINVQIFFPSLRLNARTGIEARGPQLLLHVGTAAAPVAPPVLPSADSALAFPHHIFPALRSKSGRHRHKLNPRYRPADRPAIHEQTPSGVSYSHRAPPAPLTPASTTCLSYAFVPAPAAKLYQPRTADSTGQPPVRFVFRELFQVTARLPVQLLKGGPLPAQAHRHTPRAIGDRSSCETPSKPRLRIHHTSIRWAMRSKSRIHSCPFVVRPALRRLVRACQSPAAKLCAAFRQTRQWTRHRPAPDSTSVPTTIIRDHDPRPVTSCRPENNSLPPATPTPACTVSHRELTPAAICGRAADCPPPAVMRKARRARGPPCGLNPLPVIFDPGWHLASRKFVPDGSNECPQCCCAKFLPDSHGRRALPTLIPFPLPPNLRTPGFRSRGAPARASSPEIASTRNRAWAAQKERKILRKASPYYYFFASITGLCPRLFLRLVAGRATVSHSSNRLM